MKTTLKTKNKRTYEVAREYVDKQLSGMKKHGLKTQKVSADTYDAMVEEVARAVKAA